MSRYSISRLGSRLGLAFAFPLALPLSLAVLTLPSDMLAQAAIVATPVSQGPRPPRAVRRDIPITRAIARAMAAGSRDSSGTPAAKYWQLRTDYNIDVSLDPATQQLTGKARITIHNTSPGPLTDIGLRMDPNIFLPTSPHAAPSVPAEVTGGMKISRMTVNGAPVNIASNAPPSPNSAPPAGPNRAMMGNNAPTENILLNGRTTNARIRLVSPIAAGARAVLEVDWSHKLPGGMGSGHRMTQRWADTLFQPTQWYPRIAVYDDLRGWDTEVYLGPSEFFNNFGTFDVNIDVPAGWIVGATGVLTNPEQVLTQKARQQLAKVTQTEGRTMIVGPDEVGPGKATAVGNKGRLVWRFHADTVNDFAWATAKKYVWESARAMIPEKGAVPIHMYYLPGRANMYARAPEIVSHALEFYSKLWFPYQFPQLTMTDGPSSGMEYPMLINSNQGAADHEAGHQWWPMVVGTDETWYGWMDEGFNQYMNILSDADAKGQPAVLDGRGQTYGRTAGDEAEAPMMWNANYGGPARYSFMTYSKTPLMLSMLGAMVGDSTFQRAHRQYANSWLFKHPSPWDWMFFMNKALGQDLGWFWYSWLFTTASVDGRIADVKTVDGRTTVTVAQDGDMPAPVVLKVSFAAQGPAIRSMQNAVMLDATTALVTIPVDVWFGGARAVNIALDFGGRAIEKITLDPNKRFPDVNPDDNEWTVGQTFPSNR